MSILHFLLLRQEILSGELMFDVNFISNPGINTESSNDSWSFLHKRKDESNKVIQKEKNNKNRIFDYSFNYIKWLLFTIFLAVLLIYYIAPKKIVSTHLVLNQVIDLIIESTYMKELQLEEAYFSKESVKVTIKSDQLKTIQDFTRGYKIEKNIPFEVFRKNNHNYLSFYYPWISHNNKTNIETLKNLASKTVFSNKMYINYSKDRFELEGRPSDIISFLLQMAEGELIKNFTFSIYNIEPGRFSLIVNIG